MTTQPINHDQAKALARLLHELRRDWDTEGIVTALGKARDRAPAPELAIAAIRAAGDHRNRTPAVIGLDGQHWRTPEPPPKPTGAVTAVRCDRCQWFHPPGTECDPVQYPPADAHDAAAKARRLLAGGAA